MRYVFGQIFQLRLLSGVACLFLLLLGANAQALTQSELAELIASDGDDGDQLGFAVAIDEDTAVVTAPRDDDNGNNSGSAYVYIRTANGWQEQQKLIASDGAAGNDFGWSVALEGDVAMIGARGGAGGAVYVYTRTNGVWTEQQKLTGSGFTSTADTFGTAVVMEGGTALIGAANAFNDEFIRTGTVYVFEFNSEQSAWVETQKIFADDVIEGGHFGWSLSMSGDTAVIGLGIALFFNATSSGAVYVFVRSGDSSQWSQEQKISASDGAVADAFGAAVSIDGDTVAVGAQLSDQFQGSAYIFERNSGVWGERQKILSPELASSFGRAVAIKDDVVIVTNINDVAYLYANESDMWILRDELSISDGVGDESFGQSVAISTPWAIVGSTTARGLALTSAGFSNHGAAYIYSTTPICNAEVVTVLIANGDVPTSGDDVILGTEGPDIIRGMGGNDTICGLGGDDDLNGGRGEDWIDGGAGDDTIQGANDSDEIHGGAGQDILFGGPGDDTIYGQEDDDFLSGNSGDDQLFGNEGIDKILGGAGDDEIHTGPGSNIGTAQLVTGGNGDDKMFGGPDADLLRGEAGADTIVGAGGDDELFGGGGEDMIDGEGGDDLVRGNGAADVLIGGEGDDQIDGLGGNDLMYGGAGSDTMSGSTGNDILFGQAGNDSLLGGGGNDDLHGDADTDSCDGGGGNGDIVSGCELESNIP